MAVAAPKRRSTAAPAPAPPRTTAPKRKAAAAPARRAPAKPRRAPAKPTRARASAAPARAPQRARPQPKRATQPRLALVVGRTAATVRDLPDSGLIVRMTRGRVWIAVLGVLLVGIVALNVVTLSFAASQGKVDEEITALENENSVLAARASKTNATRIVRHEAGVLGLAMPTEGDPKVFSVGPEDVSTAASRLAAAGG